MDSSAYILKAKVFIQSAGEAIQIADELSQKERTYQQELIASLKAKVSELEKAGCKKLCKKDK